MVCPRCGRENEDGKLICVECGNELKTIHIHSHRTNNRIDEIFTMVCFIIFAGIAIYLTTRYFNIEVAYVGVALILFEVFSLFVIYEIYKCLVIGKKLNIAYVNGITRDAEEYCKEYALYKKSYEKMLPGAVICLIVAIGISILIKNGQLEATKTLFMMALPICLIFMIIGICEMLRKRV